MKDTLGNATRPLADPSDLSSISTRIDLDYLRCDGDQYAVVS